MTANVVTYNSDFQVEEWLRSIGLPQYIDAFKQNALSTKESLFLLTDKQLKKELGINLLGHRTTLLHAIKKLQGNEIESNATSCRATDLTAPESKGSPTIRVSPDKRQTPPAKDSSLLKPFNTAEAVATRRTTRSRSPSPTLPVRKYGIMSPITSTSLRNSHTEEVDRLLTALTGSHKRGIKGKKDDVEEHLKELESFCEEFCNPNYWYDVSDGRISDREYEFLSSRRLCNAILQQLRLHSNTAHTHNDKAWNRTIELLLEAASIICRDVTNKKTFGLQGGIGTVVSIMSDYSEIPVIQAKGCQVLMEVSRTSLQNELTIKRSLGPETIVSTLKMHSSSREVQIFGSLAVASLCASSTETRRLFCQEGAVLLLLGAMWRFCDDAEVLQAVAAAVAKLTYMNKKAQNTLRDCNGIRSLIVALRNHPQNPGLVRWVCEAITNSVCNHKTNPDECLKLHGIEEILRVIRKHPHTSLVQQHACGALANLSSHNIRVKERIRALNGITDICMVLKLHSTDSTALRCAFVALANLAFNNKGNKLSICKIAGRDILSCMKKHRENPDLQYLASAVLANISTVKDCCKLLCELDAVTVLQSCSAATASQAETTAMIEMALQNLQTYSTRKTQRKSHLTPKSRSHRRSRSTDTIEASKVTQVEDQKSPDTSETRSASAKRSRTSFSSLRAELPDSPSSSTRTSFSAIFRKASRPTSLEPDADSFLKLRKFFSSITPSTKRLFGTLAQSDPGDTPLAEEEEQHEEEVCDCMIALTEISLVKVQRRGDELF